eukprot:9515053-Lingulodinium_polyedra.AAC.1
MANAHLREVCSVCRQRAVRRPKHVSHRVSFVSMTTATLKKPTSSQKNDKDGRACERSCVLSAFVIESRSTGY